MKIRALIVDDEQLARQRVRLLLGEEPDVEIIGESGESVVLIVRVSRHEHYALTLDVPKL